MLDPDILICIFSPFFYTNNDNKLLITSNQINYFYIYISSYLFILIFFENK